MSLKHRFGHKYQEIVHFEHFKHYYVMWWRHNPEIKPDLNSPQLKLGFEYNVDYPDPKEKFDPKFSPLLWRHNEFLGGERPHHKKDHTQNMFCTKFYQNR